MPTRHKIAVALLTASCSFSAIAQQAAFFDELAVLYPDSDTAAGTERFASDTPRGVPAGVHVLITGLPAEAPLRFGLLPDGGGTVDARTFRLIDVPVEQNTGLISLDISRA